MNYQVRAAASLVQFDEHCKSMAKSGYTLHSWRVIDTRQGPNYISVWSRHDS